MYTGCVVLAGCLLKAPISEQEAAETLYLKVTNLQNDDGYHEAATEFKQYVAKCPTSDDVGNAQLQIGNSYRIQLSYIVTKVIVKQRLSHISW